MRRLVLFFISVLFIVSAACAPVQTPDESSLDAMTSEEIVKYQYSVPLSSKEEISEVGITIDGITVEARKFKDGVYDCFGYNEELGDYSYSTYGQNSLDLDAENSENVPVMRAGDKAEITVLVDNLDYWISIWAVDRMGNYAYKGDVVDLPDEPGMYYITVFVSVDHPKINKSIIPVVGHQYVASYQYVVCVVVE